MVIAGAEPVSWLQGQLGRCHIQNGSKHRWVHRADLSSHPRKSSQQLSQKSFSNRTVVIFDGFVACMHWLGPSQSGIECLDKSTAELCTAKHSPNAQRFAGDGGVRPPGTGADRRTASGQSWDEGHHEHGALRMIGSA